MQIGRKDYVISAETDLSFAEAVNRVRDLLQEMGNGVHCEIDVKAKLEEKLGVEREPYMILGTYNPPLASVGLDAEPERMLSIVGNEELESIATRMREDLGHVVEEIAKG